MCITVEMMREIDLSDELRQLMGQPQEDGDNMVESDEFPVDDAADDCFVNAIWQ